MLTRLRVQGFQNLLSRRSLWAWLGCCALLGTAASAQAPRAVTVAVIDVDGRPLDGIALRLSGDEPDARVRNGSVTLQLPPDVEPGDDVQLHLDDRQYAFLEPSDGVLRVPRARQRTRVVLMPRGRGEQLSREEVRRGLSRQLVTRLDERGGEPSRDTLALVISELGRKYDLEPEEIDQALRAWSDAALGDRDRRLIDRYLEYFPQAVESKGGTVVFTGPVIVQQQTTRYVVRPSLEGLELGAVSKLEVVSAPAEAMQGARCSWRLRPPDYLKLTGDPRRDCSLTVRMPERPATRFGETVPLHVTVQILRDDVLQDEMQTTYTLKNGLDLHAPLTGAPITRDGKVTVSISPVGETKPLGDAYRCSWNTVPPPFVRRATAANECAAEITVQPIDDWTSEDVAAWRSSLQTGRAPSWVVVVESGGRAVPGGRIQVQVPVQDPSGGEGLEEHFRQRLRDETLQYMEDRFRRNVDDELSRLGLPPLAELKASDLRVRSELDSGRSQLRLYFVGSGDKEVRLESGKTTGLRVLYSMDGKSFNTLGRFGFGVDSSTLESLDRVWIQLQSPIRPEIQAGPFLIEMDGRSEMKSAARRAWQQQGAEEKKSLACDSLVIGGGPPGLPKLRPFLPLLKSVSVRRAEGSVWRSQAYDGQMPEGGLRQLPRVPRPMGDGAYVVRLDFMDGARETYECPARRHARKPEGLFYALERVSGDGPPEIEVYVEEERDGKWTIQYEHLIQPAYIRVATDGKTFDTIEPSTRRKHTIVVDQPRGSILHLRFGTEDGQEVGYRGPLDFDQHRRSALLKNLLVSLDLSCRLVDGDGEPAEAGEGQGVRCEVLTDRGWGSYYAGPIKVGQVAPFLRHIQYGCSRDRLDLREDFAELRAKDIDLSRIYLNFRVGKPCETVYAQMILNDGSTSEILVEPVLTGGETAY